MLADLGKVAEACDNWHMPLLAMVYARGPQVPNSYDPKVVAHCARVGVELGADIVKVPYTGDIESFSDVVSSCCVPVVIAGGELMDSTRQLLQMVHDSVKAGGAGVSIGRNVFQHPRRIELVRAMRAIVHDNADVDHALAIVENSMARVYFRCEPFDKGAVSFYKKLAVSNHFPVAHPKGHLFPQWDKQISIHTYSVLLP